MRVPWAGWSAARAATRAARTPTWTHSSWRRSVSASSAAAEVVGYAGVSFLHMPDGACRQRPDPARAPRARDSYVPPGRRPRHRPGDAVLSEQRREPHRPSRRRLRRGGRGLSRGAQPDGFPWLPRGGLAHRVRRPYLFWSDNPTAYVDTSATVARKLDALRCHASQPRTSPRSRNGSTSGPRRWASGSGWTLPMASTSS